MGAVKSWLMEMEEAALFQLEQDQTIDQARKQFLVEYPNQEHVFESICGMFSEEGHGGF